MCEGAACSHSPAVPLRATVCYLLAAVCCEMGFAATAARMPAAVGDEGEEAPCRRWTHEGAATRRHWMGSWIITIAAHSSIAATASCHR
ncbi:hypothetical protein ACLOJK_029497 [Asimina triloba]